MRFHTHVLSAVGVEELARFGHGVASLPVVLVFLQRVQIIFQFRLAQVFNTVALGDENHKLEGACQNNMAGREDKEEHREGGALQF